VKFRQTILSRMLYFAKAGVGGLEATSAPGPRRCPVNDPREPHAEVLARFRRYLEMEEGRSPRTAQEYLRDIALFLRWFRERYGRPPRFEEVGSQQVRAFLAGREVGPQRSGRLLASLRKFFRYLVEVEGLPILQDPTQGVKRPKLPRRLPVYLTPPEVARLLEAAYKNRSPRVGLRDWALLAFLYGTGLRISEALALTYGDLTYQDGIPHAIRVKGKGDRERVVVLSPTAQRALHQWLKHRNLEGHPTSPYIWSHTSGPRRGEPFSVRAVEAMVKRVARRAGLKDWARITPHKLRHSYASALVEAGRGIDEVKELLGHSSIATTQVYVHVSRKRLEEAARALPDVLG
jgi:integrase/recombinase XerD